MRTYGFKCTNFKKKRKTVKQVKIHYIPHIWSWWAVSRSHGRGGCCRWLPACICVLPGCCCCAPGGCCSSAPPPCPRSRGSVHKVGSPHSLSPTRLAGGARSCWDSWSRAVSHRCRRKGGSWRPSTQVRGRRVLWVACGRHKAACDEGR